MYPDGRHSLADVSGTYGITKAIREGRVVHDVLTCVRDRVATKRTKYVQAVSQLGLNFRPLVFEVYGGYIDTAFEDFLEHRCKLIANFYSMPFAHVYNTWRRRFDCTLRRHHASLVLGRVENYRYVLNPMPYYDHPEYLDIPLVVRAPFREMD